MLKLYNSLSRKLEDFVPEDSKRVTMYVCGPTVYDTPHIGNARPAVVFDTLYRMLRHHYGPNYVHYARNLTDIDDKIMERAAERGISISTLTEQTVVDYRTQMRALHVLPPDYEPRATHISTMGAIISLIERLIERGHAYEAEGHVLFDVASHPGHGALSRHVQENLEAGHRVAVESYKKNPSDFILWKPSTDEQPGWLSPWGRGRPGWHIECSAMISHTFGPTIDIHGGGADLRFPHHDCEISQSVCAHGTDHLARYWVHNGLVLVDGEKMAKSAGNFITVKDALTKHRPDTIRLWMLSTHYRSPIDFTEESLAQARRTMVGWHRALLTYAPNVGVNVARHTKLIEGVLDALNSDLNTPLAIAKLHELFALLPEASEKEVVEIVGAIRYAAMLLGIDLDDPVAALWNPLGVDAFETDPRRNFRNQAAFVAADQRIKEKIEQRNHARASKNWAVADNIRTMLANDGVVLEDSANDTFWYYER